MEYEWTNRQSYDASTMLLFKLILDVVCRTPEVRGRSSGRRIVCPIPDPLEPEVRDDRQMVAELMGEDRIFRTSHTTDEIGCHP